MSFAGPHYIAGQDLLVAATNTTITGPESLGAIGVRVCTVSGSTPAATLQQYVPSSSSIVLLASYADCAEALRAGLLDAVSTDNAVLYGLAQASGGALRVVGRPFTEQPYGIGIRKGDTAFCAFIDDALQKAAGDGRYAAAWTSTVGAVEPRVPDLPVPEPCS